MSSSGTAVAAAKKLQIACFHGYTSNSFVFHRRCGAIRKACRGEQLIEPRLYTPGRCA